MKAQPAHIQFGADLMLAALDLLEQAPAGAKALVGGVCVKGFSDATAEQKAKLRAQLTAISEAPTIPGIFRDRLPGEN